MISIRFFLIRDWHSKWIVFSFTMFVAEKKKMTKVPSWILKNDNFEFSYHLMKIFRLRNFHARDKIEKWIWWSHKGFWGAFEGFGRVGILWEVGSSISFQNTVEILHKLKILPWKVSLNSISFQNTVEILHKLKIFPWNLSLNEIQFENTVKLLYWFKKITKSFNCTK